MVGGYHHFRKPPDIVQRICFTKTFHWPIYLRTFLLKSDLACSSLISTSLVQIQTNPHNSRHRTPVLLVQLVANYIQLAMFLLKWFCVTKFLVFQCFCCVKTEWHDIEKNVRFRHKYLYQWPSSTVQQPDASPATPARLTRMLQMWARPMKRHVSGSSLLGFWLLCASKFQPCGLTAHAFSTVGPSTFQSK